MSLATTTSGERRPLSIPGWRFWVVNGVVAPLAACTGVYVSLYLRSSDPHTLPTVLTIAAVAAVVYALVARYVGTSLRTTVMGYLLAVVLIVPWGYTFVIGLLLFACGLGTQCD